MVIFHTSFNQHHYLIIPILFHYILQLNSLLIIILLLMWIIYHWRILLLSFIIFEYIGIFMLIKNSMSFSQILKKMRHHINSSCSKIVVKHAESLYFIKIPFIFIIISKNLTLRCQLNEIIVLSPLSRIILICFVINTPILID